MQRGPHVQMGGNALPGLRTGVAGGSPRLTPTFFIFNLCTRACLKIYLESLKTNMY